MHLMIIDIIIVVILAFFAFTGYRKGFLSEISIILALAIGFLMANIFHTDILSYIQEWIHNDSLSTMVAYLLIFLAVAAAVRLVVVLLQKFLEWVLLGWLNRVLGVLLGLLKGLLLISILIFVLQSFPRAQNLHQRMDRDSYMYHICLNLKDWVITAITTHPDYDKYWDRLKKQTDEENIQALLKKDN